MGPSSFPAEFMVGVGVAFNVLTTGANDVEGVVEGVVKLEDVCVVVMEVLSILPLAKD